ncbi:MAG: hypothetical protein ACI95C_002190 [Pseudohongiellaceae bacterium]
MANSRVARALGNKGDRSIFKKQDSLYCSLNKSVPFVLCTWSGKRLQLDGFEIDHCFPWSRWLNNDLWNLLPASQLANNQKLEKLPSAALMHELKKRILDWWEQAYSEEGLRNQFQMEAESALPLAGGASFANVFEAMLYQRARLRADQQLTEWK